MPAVLRFETREVAHGFRMRVLRIFLVAAHFPVDRNYRRGNMNCKAHQELCRRDLLLPRDALAHVTLASLLECALAKNVPANPLECAFTKSLDLKSPEINTCRKYGGVPPPCLSQSSFVVRCSSLLICGSNFFPARFCCVLPSAFTSGSGVLDCGVRSRKGGTADAWNFGLCATIPRKPRQARKGATVAGALRVPRRTRSSSHRFIRILL